MQTTSEFSNLVDMLVQRAAASADTLMATVVSDHGKQESRMTFGELDAAARQIGEQLVQRGLTGRNLLLLYPPGLDYIKAFLPACMAAAFQYRRIHPPVIEISPACITLHFCNTPPAPPDTPRA